MDLLEWILMPFAYMHIRGCGQNCLVKGFQYSKEYASKFEPLKDFFSENETLDLKTLEGKNHGRPTPPLLLPSLTPFFRLSCDSICRRGFL